MANRNRTRSDGDLNEIEKWGVPNWKKPEGYPDWERLNIHQQKWEFLRRTKEYRSDWGRLEKKEETTINSKPVKFSRCFDRKEIASKYSISEAVSPKLDYTKLPPNFAFKQEPLRGGEIKYPLPPKPKLLTKKEEEGLSWDERLAYYATIEAPKPAIPNPYNLLVWIEFDLSQSLTHQLNQAEINLQKAKKEAQRFMDGLKNDTGLGDPYDYAPQKVGERKPRVPSVDQYILLLRIFDAKNAKNTNSKISITLNEVCGTALDDSTISKKYKTAAHLWSIL